MTIRDVRPTDDFYRDVDQALLLAGGGLSRADFGLYLLTGILGRFATAWDELPMPIRGRPEYRVLIGYSGHLGAYAIEGQMAADGVIEVVVRVWLSRCHGEVVGASTARRKVRSASSST